MTEKHSKIGPSARGRSLAAFFLCCTAIVAGAFFFFQKEDAPQAGAPCPIMEDMSVRALAGGAVFPHAHAPQPGPDQLATLGSGMAWMREYIGGGGLASGDEPRRFDDSLSAFLSEKAEICVPDHSDPEPWEAHPRYTVEDNGCGQKIYRGKIRGGDHIGGLFRPWIDKADVDRAVKAASSVFKVKRLRQGRPFFVEQEQDGQFLRFVYEIDDERRLVVSRKGDAFEASVDVCRFDTKLARVEGSVASSLVDAVREAGEDSELAMRLADVFSHQVDFVNAVQEGDSFRLIVEKRYSGGQFRRYGDIVAARFVNAGVVYEAFRFLDDDGVSRYYAADGTSLETQFLKAPLNFTRISSKFTMKRRHPVFGRVRPHQGVDYAAPRGTPVKALGEGVVSFVGWKSGYGKSVAIQHRGGVETHYAHLSRYVKGLKKGDKVEQGQLIAFVGTTGTATGPHLDFRVKKNGRFIDPLSLSGDSGAPVRESLRRHFDLQVSQARLMLDGEAILAVK